MRSEPLAGTSLLPLPLGGFLVAEAQGFAGFVEGEALLPDDYQRGIGQVGCAEAEGGEEDGFFGAVGLVAVDEGKAALSGDEL